MSSLVIVESPAKARTISKFLGAGYVVESSIGHIRDLPRSAAEVPAVYKGEPWARLGVDTANDFKPLYVVAGDKKSQVKHLKGLLAEADELFLATDEDREGEAIAWHLLEVLSPKVPVRRMVFHEITPDAIQAAIDNPRELDRRMVDAQEARRILDRLYGYEVSPVLWKKVMPRLSAGRVQSVATRIVVERERARMAFQVASYWDLKAQVATTPGDGAASTATRFGAQVIELDGVRLATSRDFNADGQLTREGALVLDEPKASALAAALADAAATVTSVEAKPYTRRPYPPFMTSTLQQEAGRKLRFSSAQTMSVAQRLYENGFITYMRTDSTTLSESALKAARSEISQRYGAPYLPKEPRTYKKKVKNAQEAHEAIRPAGDSFRAPDEVRDQLRSDEFRLYELIWRRTVASQMNDARGESVQVRLSAQTNPTGGASAQSVTMSASGRTILFPGFLAAYVEGEDDGAEADDAESVLPDVSEGQAMVVDEAEAKGHETQPPSRFTEASLVKRLEELGGVALVADLASRSATDALVAAIAAHGRVDILVNNAGIAESAPLAATTDDLWDRILEVDVTAPFRLTRALVPAMVAAGWGRVVHMASNAGLTGYPYTSAYCAAKHALVGLTRALAVELCRDRLEFRSASQNARSLPDSPSGPGC